MTNVNKILKWFQNVPIDKFILHPSGRKNKNPKNRKKNIFEDLTEALSNMNRVLSNRNNVLSNKNNVLSNMSNVAWWPSWNTAN